MVAVRDTRADIYDEAPYEWMTLIHASCLSVANSHRDVVNAVTVSRRFTGLSAAERARLLATARLVAEEHGLAAETEDSGQTITARFSRVETELDAAAAEGTDSGLISRLLGAVRHSASQAQANRMGS